MARKYTKKSQFSDLPGEFKDAVDGMDYEQIKERIAQVALDNEELLAAKKNDEDLASKKEATKEASAVYREGSKINILKIRYAKAVLETKGRSVKKTA